MDVSTPSAAPTLALAMERVQRLDALLEEEFEALKVQDLDRFELLLNAKTELLVDLGRITGVPQPDGVNELGPEWDTFKAEMLLCRDKHRRNEILILRKLDAIRGALESIQVADPTSSVEVYDRLGQIRRMRRARGYSEA